MHTRLSTIALGVALACAANAALASPTSTTAQVGSGNSAFAEQDAVSSRTVALITQIGNNNIAGDPASYTPGILQTHVNSLNGDPTTITQIGDANQAVLTQSRGEVEFEGTISQTGNLNAASLVEYSYFTTSAYIKQTGNSNVASLTHSSSGGAGGWVFQDGERNGADIHNYGLVDASTLTRQTGSDNQIYVDHTTGNHSPVHIEQTGTSNTAITLQAGGQFTQSGTLQNGTGNFAGLSQESSHNSNEFVRQSGDGNVATLTQTLNYNQADIVQNGDLNTANIGQSGASMFAPPNTAYTIQAGNGFSAAIAQAGSGNLVGIYQH